MCSYPPKFPLHLCPAQQELRKFGVFWRPPSGWVFCIFSPQKRIELIKRGATVHTAQGAPLGAFFVLSAISNWTSSAYCAPLKELKICLWNFRGAAIYVSPYAAGSFTVSFWLRATCMCLARISHISPGIYIKTLYEIIKHSGRASSHPTHPIRFRVSSLIGAIFWIASKLIAPNGLLSPAVFFSFDSS